MSRRRLPDESTRQDTSLGLYDDYEDDLGVPWSAIGAVAMQVPLEQIADD
jgi:hypothetical protein